MCASFLLIVLVCFRPFGCGEAMTVARNLWGYIDRRDHRLMRRINRWRAPRWFRIWLIAATRMGDGWIWYRLGLMLLAYGVPPRFSAILAPRPPPTFALLGLLTLKQ